MITGLGHQGSALQGYADTRWLSKLNGRALVVCRIVLGENQGSGTGFLIGKDLIMTNNHVLDCLESARAAKAHFFYTKDSEGVEVGLNPDNFFYTSPTPDLRGFDPITKGKFDFTIVSIYSHPKITEVSHLAFSIFYTTIPKTESNANIIHHPIDPEGTSYQKVSFRENLVKEISLYTIHYTTTTLPGSSGSPVIDDEGNLIALHRATCTHILKALLKEKMLIALLAELFPGILFTNQTLTLIEREFTGLCAAIHDSPLYIFSEGELKGQYFHQGKVASLFRLIQTKHPSPKKWALEFLNSRLEEPLADYHKECNTAVPIKAIHDHLNSVNLLPQIQARYEESQKSLCNLLKESYLQKCASLPLLLTNAAFPIESFFTQLSIVSYSSQEKKEDEARQRDPHLVEKDSLREIYARLCATEKPIEINNLFDSHKRVLVLGRAGIGKSTLCQKIAYDWAAGTLFNQKFALVYHIKLRDFNSKNKEGALDNPTKWLSQMIAESCYAGAHQAKILQELQNNPEKILLIFDGWDEASPELTQALETYFLQTQVHYLLTSRPGVTSKIQGNFDLIVENMGFSRTQVETYIEKFFTHTKCAGVDLFLKMLRSRSNLLTIAHIPIQLQILCALWQKGEQEFPQTLAPLFSKITHHLFVWEQNKNLQKERLTPLKHLFLYQALGEVALRGLESKQLIIPSKLVETTLIEKSLENNHFQTIKPQDLLATGLIKECASRDEIYFLHLTYQEYSIAHYITTLPKTTLDKKGALEKQRSFVQTYRYQPHFHLVIRILAGSLWEESRTIEKMELFFEWLYTPPADLIGSYQTELVLSCLAECPSEELEKKIWEKYKIADFINSMIKHETRRDCLIRLMALSGRVLVQYLKKEGYRGNRWFFENIGRYAKKELLPLLLEGIQTALRDQGSLVRSSAARALGALAPHVGKEQLPLLLEGIQTALRDQGSLVRSSAARALGALAPQVGKDQLPLLLEGIQTALRDQDSDVRRAAARALGALAPQVGKEQLPLLLEGIQTALRDQDSDVRSSAARALGALAPHAGKEHLPLLLEWIQRALREQNWGVRLSAAEALGALASHAGKEQLPLLLEWIQTALRDQEKDVRLSAAEALGALAPHVEKEHLPLLLEWIQTALRDQDSDVRSSAAYALGALASHAGKEHPPLFLEGIQTALRDQDSDVRSFAASALGALATHAEKDHLTLLLEEVQTALRDEDKYVRSFAAYALGALAPHAGKEHLPLLLEWIQTALSNQDKYVRSSAAYALRALAPSCREHLTLLLEGIQTVLRDQDKDVRKAAAEALGVLAPHAGKEHPPLFLEGIQTALRDQDSYVRSSAAYALRALAPHAGKEHLPLLLEGIQRALRDQDKHVCLSAAEAFGALAPHAGKEHLPLLLEGIQTALKAQDSDVCRAAAQALCSLKIKYLLSIFVSQPPSYPQLIPLIFEHFINQSIPLYLIENSGGCSIHTSGTCYEAFNLKQLRPLSNRCTALFIQTWTESAESEDIGKETCVVM